MELYDINLVYFSATGTTGNILKTIAGRLGNVSATYNVTHQPLAQEVFMKSSDLMIIGVPVYAGRVPAIAMQSLRMFRGEQTPAIIVCVYGNRDYDDALLELNDLMTENNFKVISAGAFIAQHAIFPQVGRGRPDATDLAVIHSFADKSKDVILSVKDLSVLPAIRVKGSKPYKTPGAIPLKPKGNRKCNACGTCVKLCPVHAIPEHRPRRTDKEKCITCGCCIVVCPQQSRHLGGLLYKIAGNKFTKAYAAVRKEPEMIFPLQ